jgi:hypothetical protein
MGRTWPIARLVHPPVHASWLNQSEIFFSIAQRKVIKPGDFAYLDEWPRGCWPSRTATTPPPNPSTGATPQVPRLAARTAHRPRTAHRMSPDVSTESSASYFDLKNSGPGRV